MIEIWKTFTFDAAHFLPNVPPGHKCGRMHGHTYTVEIRLRGEVGVDGWIRDLGDIGAFWQGLEGSLDHRLLNDLLPNPTSELLAEWVLTLARAELPEIHSVTVRETASSGATVFA